MSRSCFARASSISAPAAADDACQAWSIAPLVTAAPRVVTACDRELGGRLHQRVRRGQVRGRHDAGQRLRGARVARFASAGSSAAAGPASRLMSSSPRRHQPEIRKRHGDGAPIAPKGRDLDAPLIAGQAQPPCRVETLLQRRQDRGDAIGALAAEPLILPLHARDLALHAADIAAQRASLRRSARGDREPAVRRLDQPFGPNARR